MKKLALSIAILALVSTTATIKAQVTNDTVYAAKFSAEQIQSISVNPNTGAVTGSFGTPINTEKTAALGFGKFGANDWLVSLQYTTDDKVDIYAVKTSGGTNYKIKNDADIANGSSDLDYVRLGVDENGIGWIVSKETNSNTLYAASFTWDGNTSHDAVITKRGKLNTDDNSNSIFINGDLAISGTSLFVLANNGSGSTKLYIADETQLIGANSNSTNTLAYKWTLKTSTGSDFTGQVNGFAFSNKGSAYLSTSSGLYFIDQNTTNFSGTGTVKCALIKSESDISDLATGTWPKKTALPITGLESFNERDDAQGNLLFTWTSQTESNNKQFELEMSNDAITFTRIATIASKAPGGNSSKPISYQCLVFPETVKASASVASTNHDGNGGTTAAIAVLACVPFFFSRRSSMVAIFIVTCGLAITAQSCTKTNDSSVKVEHSKKYFRLKQVDIDGHYAYSQLLIRTV